jgi:hypothetical protein
MNKIIKIGSFSNQWFSHDYTAKFNEWMNDAVVFWFFYCIYEEKEISDKFENSATILKKREYQMHWIEEIANDSGWSINTIKQKIKNGMTSQWPHLSTIEAIKQNIENNLFTGRDNEWIKNRALEFCDDYYAHRNLETVEQLSIQIRAGSPTLYAGSAEIRPIIDDPGYDPGALTPEEIEAARLAAIEAAKQNNTNNAGFGGMALNIALGGMILYSLFTRNNKK